MIKEGTNFNLIIDQRYYYFVTLHDIGGYSLNEFWNQTGSPIIQIKQTDDFNVSDIEIQHKRIKSNIPYPRGKLLEATSISGNGSGPYIYDILAVRTTFDNESYFALAFPFHALARDILEKAINTHNLRHKCNILKVNLPALILNKDLQFSAGEFRTNVSGLQVIISDDPALSSLSIGGDNPMESAIYKNYLDDPIKKGKMIVDQCILKCEFELQETNLKLYQRKKRAQIHIDAFGNFKFYMHINGDNFITIPYLIQRLKQLNCLSSTSINPLIRLEKEID
jgi:hypothetical protein